MSCPAVFVVPPFALSVLLSLPWMLLWLPAVLLPLVIARVALRRARRVPWAAIDLVTAAARRIRLTGDGVPLPLLLIRAGMLLLAVLAAARPFLSESSGPGTPGTRPVGHGSRIVAGSAVRRIAVVVPDREAIAIGSQPAGESNAAADGSLPLRLAIAALGRMGGFSGGAPPVVDIVGVAGGLADRLTAAKEGDVADPSRLLLVLCDGAVPAAADAERIAAAVERGASLLVLVGPATLESTDRDRLSDWLASLAGVAVAGRVECDGCRIGVTPELADEVDASGGAVESGELFVALPGPGVDRCAELFLDPQSSRRTGPPAAVLAQTIPDGKPLLVESRAGNGRVCVSALPLSLPAARDADEFWSDLAAWPVFVPLVDRLLARLLVRDEAVAVAADPSVNRADERHSALPFRGLSLASLLLSLAILLAVLDPLVSLALSSGAVTVRRAAVDAPFAAWSMTAGDRARHAGLLPARAAILGSLIAMLLLWNGRSPSAPDRRPPRPRRVALLIDVSPSMATADAVSSEGERSSASQRLTAVLRSLTSAGPSGAPLERLCRDRQVSVAAVGPEIVPLGDASPTTAASLIGGLAAVAPAARASRQGDAVVQAIADAADGLAAVVIASDGAIEDGLSWTRAAQVAINRRVPIVAIPAGGGGTLAEPDDPDEAASDVAFTAVRMPPVSWVGEQVAIGVRAERLAPGSDPIPVALADRNGRVLAEGLLRSETAGDSREPSAAGLRGDLHWTPGETGERTLLVRTGRPAALAATPAGVGNAVAVTGWVVDDPIRVMLVDAVPRFEYRFLEQLLARDPRFEVQTCLLESAAAEGMRSTATVPMSAADWDRFDVVVLGDAVMGSDTFPESAATGLREAAASAGIGIAWSPGRRFRAAAGMNGAGDWLPALPLETSARPAVAPRRLQVAPAGRDGGWFPWPDDAAAGTTAPFDGELFATLGPVRLRPTARILAVSEPRDEGAATSRSDSGVSRRRLESSRSLPAVVLDRLGAATILCHLCETWRWRDHGGAEAYEHYWRQSLMRLAQPHFLGRLVPGTIDIRPLQPREGDDVRIDVTATRPTADRAGWSLEHAGPATPADAPRPIGLTQPLHTLRMERLEPGWHTLRLRTPAGPAVTREFPVRSRAVERPGPRARVAGMEAAAIASGGAVVPLDRIASLPDTIGQLERRAEARRASPEPATGRGLLDSPAASRRVANLLMIALVVSCAVEWSLRSRRGLS